MDKHRRRLLCYLLGINIGIIILAFSKNWERRFGTILLILLTATIIFSLLAVRETIFLVSLKSGRKRKPGFFTNVIVTISTLLISLCLIELVLFLHQWIYPPAAGDSFAKTLTIPDEWEKRPVIVKGSYIGFYWHGILHHWDKRGMRRFKPFPSKKEKVCRIMVVGDSLTYGHGVEEENTYGRVLEGILSEEYHIEVLNLGICGLQSRDILEIVLEFAPILKPDLFVYGICLNDFLPSGVGQYKNNLRWPFPLPGYIKSRLARQTYTGKFFERAYDQLLIRIGIRSDFYDDILENFKNYQGRFADDLLRMNSFVVKNGFPPILAVVFHQRPVYSGRGHRIARIAEAAVQKAGMTVVPTDEYFKKYDGQSMRVSKWEGHPNRKAHRILAEMLAPVIRKMPGLNKYKK